MTAVKSPGAVAARGAWKIDLLGSKVDSEDSLRSLTAQPLRLRAGIQKISTSLRLSHASTIAAVFTRRRSLAAIQNLNLMGAP